MKILKSNKLVLIIACVFGVLLLIGLMFYITLTLPKQKKDAWQHFKTYANTLRLPNESFIYTKGFTSGCFKDDTGYGDVSTCTFSSKQFYKINGNYKDAAHKIEMALRQQGFDFKEENSKYLFETHVNNQNINVDLSNAAPLVSDFINLATNTEVRLSIGDKTRLNPQGPTGLTPELFKSFSDEKLLAILDFSKTYK